MFKKISEKIPAPDWWKADARFWQLELYDRLLDGKFYDHLSHAFYTEVEEGREDKIIPIEDRRPSARFNLPSSVARMTARKLFAGRHIPRIHHKNAEVKKQARLLAKQCGLYQQMLDLVVRGSVGAVAATFAVFGEPANPGINITIWRAKHCVPTFDTAGELESLEVRYIVPCAAMQQLGAPGCEEGRNYWYRRIWTKAEDTHYLPVDANDWNPVEGWRNEEARALGWRVWDDARFTQQHNFGFVPGHWFRNLVGGNDPDGASTWAPAIDNAIDLDYTKSQIGRGVRYNAAPQLVVIGEVIKGGGEITRSPMAYIHVSAGQKNEDGETEGAGDAKLLEMTGQGVEAGIKFCESLRKEALEQIQAARKDPEQMKGPMSGRAMEYLDDEWHDLVMELRSSYGDCGMLPLLRKMMIAKAKHTRSNANPDVDGLSLMWPNLFQPTPTDLAQMLGAFALAANPMKRSITPGKPATATAAAVPGVGPPGKEEQILTLKEIRSYLAMAMDLGILDDDDDDDDDEPPEAQTGDLPVNPPTPLADGGGAPSQEEPPPADDPLADPFARTTAAAVARVTGGAPS